MIAFLFPDIGSQSYNFFKYNVLLYDFETPPWLRTIQAIHQHNGTSSTTKHVFLTNNVCEKLFSFDVHNSSLTAPCWGCLHPVYERPILYMRYPFCIWDTHLYMRYPFWIRDTHPVYEIPILLTPRTFSCIIFASHSSFILHQKYFLIVWTVLLWCVVRS